MSKSKIIIELANNQIQLDNAINRLLIISSDLENQKLYKWCLMELEGYRDNDPVPNYRTISSKSIIYTGTNGAFQITKQPLPLSLIPYEILEDVSNYEFREGIRTLLSRAESKEELNRDLSSLAGIVLKNSGSMIQCISIKQLFDEHAVIEVLGRIRSKLLRIFIKLDKEIGNLDSLDVSIDSLSEPQLTELNNDLLEYIEYDNYRETGKESLI